MEVSYPKYKAMKDYSKNPKHCYSWGKTFTRKYGLKNTTEKNQAEKCKSLKTNLSVPCDRRLSVQISL